MQLAILLIGYRFGKSDAIILRTLAGTTRHESEDTGMKTPKCPSPPKLGSRIES